MPEPTGIPVVTDAAATGTAVADEGVVETGAETGAEGAEGAGAGEGAAGDGAGGGEAGAGDGELPAEGEPTEEELLAELETDGRKVDSKTRSAIAKLAATDKVAAKAVRDSYFSNQALLKEAGATNTRDAVAKIRNMSATIESLGGEDGINELQEKVGDYDREIAQFAEGDPALLQQLYEANSKSVVTMAQHTLEMLASKDVEQLDEAILPTFVARLDKVGFPRALTSALALVKEGKGQEAFDILTQMDTWWKTTKEKADKRIEMRTAKNPEAEAVARERAEIASERKTLFDNAMGDNLNRMNNRAMAKVVDRFFTQMKMQPEGRRRFVNGLQSEIFATMKGDKTFQRQNKTIRSKGDPVASAEHAHRKFIELLPEAFRKYRNELYPGQVPEPKITGAGKGPAKTAGAAAAKPAAAAGAPVRVTSVDGQKPNRDDVDWKKTNDTDWFRGKAVLKNGKEVTWDWKKV